MIKPCYRRHRFPIDVIQQAVWLYFQFPLSLRNVEDLLTQRGIDVSYETVRRWSVKFGLAYARKLRHSHPRADVRWHLDEVFVRINGKCVYLWRAVDCEGETALNVAGFANNVRRGTQMKILNDALMCHHRETTRYAIQRSLRF
jgi:putative transposase